MFVACITLEPSVIKYVINLRYTESSSSFTRLEYRDLIDCFVMESVKLPADFRCLLMYRGVKIIITSRHQFSHISVVFYIFFVKKLRSLQ